MHKYLFRFTRQSQFLIDLRHLSRNLYGRMYLRLIEIFFWSGSLGSLPFGSLTLGSRSLRPLRRGSIPPVARSTPRVRILVIWSYIFIRFRLLINIPDRIFEGQLVIHDEQPQRAQREDRAVVLTYYFLDFDSVAEAMIGEHDFPLRLAFAVKVYLVEVLVRLFLGADVLDGPVGHALDGVDLDRDEEQVLVHGGQQQPAVALAQRHAAQLHVCAPAPARLRLEPFARLRVLLHEVFLYLMQMT